MPDEIQPERIEGGLPSGAAYALIYWHGPGGMPVADKSEASTATIFEYREDGTPMSITTLNVVGTEDD